MSLGFVEANKSVVQHSFVLMIESTDRFSRDQPRFSDTLDVIKFLCKDMWTLVFRKQIDNLKTNHRVWVLYTFLPG